MYLLFFVQFLLITCITKVSFAKIEKEVSIWQELETPKDVNIMDEVDNTKKLKEELKTLNQFLKKILTGNFGSMVSVPKVGLIYNEPKNDTLKRYKEDLNNDLTQEAHNETIEKLNNGTNEPPANKSKKKSDEVYKGYLYNVPKEELLNELKNKPYSEPIQNQFIKPMKDTFDEIIEKPYIGNKNKIKNSSEQMTSNGHRILKVKAYNKLSQKQFSIPKTDSFKESKEKSYTGNNEKIKNSPKYTGDNEYMGEPNNELNDLVASIYSCNCSDFININGYGQCKKGSYKKRGGSVTCYVNLPSDCYDLIESGTNPGFWYSAEACRSNSGFVQWSNCPKEVTVKNIATMEGVYIRQEKIINGKVYYRDTHGVYCISWDKKYGYWWIQGCSYIGLNMGVSYLDNQKEECPTSNANSQVWISVPLNGLHIPLAKVEEYFCQTVDSELCVFPFKWGEVTYYTCAQNGAFMYKWCATSLNKNGLYNSWNYCTPQYQCSEKPQKRGYNHPTHHSYWEFMFG